MANDNVESLESQIARLTDELQKEREQKEEAKFYLLTLLGNNGTGNEQLVPPKINDELKQIIEGLANVLKGRMLTSAPDSEIECISDGPKAHFIDPGKSFITLDDRTYCIQCLQAKFARL